MTTKFDIVAFAVTCAGVWTPFYTWLFALDRLQMALTAAGLLAAGALLGFLIFGLRRLTRDDAPPAAYRLTAFWRR